jgi:hypothetical protein
MSTLTSTLPARTAYEDAAATPLVPSAKRTQPSFFARALARLIEARRRQAMMELHRHGLRLPSELEVAGQKITGRNEDALPFV